MAQFGALWCNEDARRPREWKSFGVREMRENYGEKKWRAQQELNLQPLVP
jgi:hypothetical protein